MHLQTLLDGGATAPTGPQAPSIRRAATVTYELPRYKSSLRTYTNKPPAAQARPRHAAAALRAGSAARQIPRS